MDADDGRLVSAVVEWLFGAVLLDVRSKPADQRSSSSIRSVIWRYVAYGIQRRTAGKSVRYAGELVVPEPLDAVRRNLPL